MNKQMDLFIHLTSSDVVTKHSRDLMERCWFSLGKKRRLHEIKHETKEGNWVKITDTKGNGIASIWDMNVLMFATSYIVDRMNRGLEISPKIRFSSYEYQYFTGKKFHGGRLDRDLRDSLERLHTTRVETNIRNDSDNKEHYKSFYWVSGYEKYRENGRVTGYSLELPFWFYNTIINHKQILTIDYDYFGITGGLERWLYMWCRKSSGYRETLWKESFVSLHKKSGSSGTLKSFTHKLRKIIEKQSVPFYWLNERDKVLYIRRMTEKEKKIIELEKENKETLLVE